MSDHDPEISWARARIEAMADGSLDAEAERRMRAAMRADPALAAAVGRARRLTRDLARRGRAPVPARLTRRLLDIARPAAAPFAWRVPAAAAAGAVVALTGLLALEQLAQPDARRAAAVRDFRVAMTYLQHSAAATGDGVTRELTRGLHDALATSREAVADIESRNGEHDDEEN